MTRAILRVIAAVGFVLAGVNHFYKPAFYVSIIPPWFPAPGALEAISGVCEAAGGLGLLIPTLRRAAGWGLLALLVAVFPANIYMAIASHRIDGLHIPEWALWLRLPMQGVLGAWVWFVALAPKRVHGVAPLHIRSIAWLIVAVMCGTGCSKYEMLDATIPATGYVLTADIPYGGERRQKLDIYEPQHAEANAGVIVFFYGGSWTSGRKQDYRFAAQALSSRGFVTIIPDYRVYPEATFPTFLEDGARAVRWARDNAKRFGGDPRRLYLMGHSAGAHIAAMLTLDRHYLHDAGLPADAIRATAALSGPYDFLPRPEDRPALAMGLTDKPPDAIEPIHFADGQAPPMLLLHGEADEIVGPHNAIHLAAKLQAAGAESKLILYKNRGHAGVAMALAWPFRWLDPVLDDVIGFFDQHGKR